MLRSHYTIAEGGIASAETSYDHGRLSVEVNFISGEATEGKACDRRVFTLPVDGSWPIFVEFFSWIIFFCSLDLEI